MPVFDALQKRIPIELKSCSGKVFYSGRGAFAQPSSLYVLGLNPGGDPYLHVRETVGSHTSLVRDILALNWSAYRDESWEGAAPGTWGMQPRVLHMFRNLSAEPGLVPCSNLVFVRSRSEAQLKRDFPVLAELCWPFHEYAIGALHSKAIVCFGKVAGDFVRYRLAAHTLRGEFTERNQRGWRSQCYVNAAGLNVAVLTHPSRVEWANPDADPTHLVAEAIA